MAKRFYTEGKKGFTLVEMMVVIGIIGVIIALAVPNFAGMQRRARIKAAAQTLAQDLRQIRERALSKGIRHVITFDIPNRRYIVTYAQDTSIVQKNYLLGQTTGGNIIFGAIPGVTGRPPEGSLPAPGNGGIDFPGNTLIIDARGGATKGVIYITDRRESYAVGINTLGKVRVYRYGNNRWN
ncbi:MAG: prepilin-type N-terminal cleavage/methylation domain-containing protein [candidate division WOR-3 bacterium]|nr:prepilin-type N-terminal cleavage/methylation domain-containing protein [candidate division WOR-3 bacterium]